MIPGSSVAQRCAAGRPNAPGNNNLFLNGFKMTLFKDYVRSGIWTGLMLLLFSGSTAHAQSACKGLASGTCSGKSSCVWVDGYTRKDNRKVSGYCRAKGGKGATTGKTAKKAALSRGSSSASEPSSPETKKTSSSKNKKVTGKKSATKSSGTPSKKKKTAAKKKSAEKSKSDSGKAKKKEKKKTKKPKSTT